MRCIIIILRLFQISRLARLHYPITTVLAKKSLRKQQHRPNPRQHLKLRGGASSAPDWDSDPESESESESE